MIISHKYKYLFVEIPLTGSYSIRHELCSYYDGSPILHKHATYPDFRKMATAEERDYFVFATVRNPLDKLVSRYFKYRMDHKGAFSNPESPRTLVADYSDLRKYEIIKGSDLGFDDYFRRYCKRPYGDLIDLSGDHLDYVIRFERLQEDFSHVLRLLEIEQVRPVPHSNKTRGRRANWESYYTPDIIEQAKRVCGPYMRKWNYEFPSHWGKFRFSWTRQAQYNALTFLRSIYLIHFRYSNRAIARVVRSLRAHFI
jgi:hypothetical protein